ncbi:MAG: lycopene cyclase domain-containing protein [Actinomycetales bacterium]|nr:lycopene cyclase domain-containing protein [Actinomycetales bacterium]
MALAYLTALLVSIVCLGLIDHRWRLALFRDARATLVTVAIGVAFFLAWDLGGIALGVFFRGEGPWMTGLLLAPELPLEEVFFLILLCYNTLVAWRGAEAWLATRAHAATRSGERS